MKSSDPMNVASERTSPPMYDFATLASPGTPVISFPLDGGIAVCFLIPEGVKCGRPGEADGGGENQCEAGRVLTLPSCLNHSVRPEFLTSRRQIFLNAPQTAHVFTQKNLAWLAHFACIEREYPYSAFADSLLTRLKKSEGR